MSIYQLWGWHRDAESYWPQSGCSALETYSPIETLLPDLLGQHLPKWNIRVSDKDLTVARDVSDGR